MHSVCVVESHVTVNIRILSVAQQRCMLNLCHQQQCQLLTYVPVFERNCIPTNFHSSRVTYRFCIERKECSFDDGF
jgi:hypothetical protein